MSFRSARLAAGLSGPAGHRETKGDGCGGLHVGDRHAGTEGQPLAGDRRAVRLHGGRAVEEGG